MMVTKKMALFAAVDMGLTATSGAFAASTADLTVIGTIVPSSCNIALSTNEIKLGKISSSELTIDAPTELRPHNLQVGVTCDAPAKFSLSSVDNTPGTAADTADTSFGLGKTSSNQNFGYFNMRFDSTSLDADAASVIGLASTDNATWSLAPTTPPAGNSVAGPAIAHGANFLAFGDSGAPTAVINIEEFSGTLQVRTFIARADGLTLTSEEDFAGSATIEVNYL